MPDSMVAAKAAEFLRECTIWWMDRVDKNQILLQNFNYGENGAGSLQVGM